ncbi:ArsJ-associated glyceraldehyde-3-phosphate dehydrogenase [Phaeobacter italicus]|uniref:ArsJ-associated glyceraldehyde-3-phosphate dehydrogenase n=1 Tax=Phaeobacter italicus TaxID=481446 RepID=UPI00055EF00B|nr:ArsJ-associated glyceraldehyde-3-phosphate dehydrogenase [Phaeobacter italicus]MBY6045458.1 ArsJ-associated glyceraldehyde-3-phosphate dehydrogenase [Phaeobacter italicus]MCA0858415.1 ArsJ-associated glyceraldehyde-3-phosphate dehydrogenase [Phaeobacter italicus]MCI5098973.1 ArsJ-associated glyceraldehyde-3-phosphate dehydrogenase [Phaeobacter italicus]NKX71580.1 ArsJ-associated glyceraldehyde-3-phosphate dehydrogenase [Rhodobacteraceae bacterium R_SAG1]
MTVYALNGLGRMGKLALKPLLESGAEIAWINDAVGSPEMHAHLLEFDSVHGRWQAAFSHDADSITIDGTRLPVHCTQRIEDLPLEGVDVVIDCTGVFKTEAKLAPYFDAGVKKVVVSAPVKDGDAANIVYGVNNDVYEPARHRIVTAASCTTNCLAPVVKVLHEEIGIKHGSITTIHDVTNTQTIVDRPAKDLRRARSALTSLIPTTTGSATAITLIYPDLKGKLNGHAVRVPLLNASITDCVFELDRATTAEEVNALFKAAAEGPLAGILGYEERPLVSADYTNDTRSSIVDALSTLVVNGTQVKVYAWYDNEMGYAHRLVDVARMVGDSL